MAADTVQTYSVVVEGWMGKATLIHDTVDDVLEELRGQLDALYHLHTSDKPITVRIDDDGQLATLTISRVEMTKAEREALPEFEGW